MFIDRGRWWNDSNIKLVEINGSVYALAGWNGETYGNCWECSGDFLMDASERKYEISPIYTDDDGNCEIVDYEVL